jgi:hypothetical protein
MTKLVYAPFDWVSYSHAVPPEPRFGGVQGPRGVIL